MSNQTNFLLARVRDEEAKAEAATLVNVRNNHLRAAAAWRALAERAVKGDEMRAAETIRKAERDAAAAAAEAAAIGREDAADAA